MFQLAKQDSVAKMKIGSGGIESGLDTKRLARCARLLQFFAQLRLLYDFRGAFLDVRQLFVNGSEGWHACALYEIAAWIVVHADQSLFA